MKFICFLLRVASVTLWLVSFNLGIILLLALLKGNADRMFFFFIAVMLAGTVLGIYCWKRSNIRF